MQPLTFDSLGFRLDDRDVYFVSGEFHYFRVPKADWRRRMQLFLDAGGNCLATYVPWLIHEPEEGDIRFGDVDGRDLQGFLALAQEMCLKVVLRPGPYQYSELNNDGLPGWLVNGYPEILARGIDGEPFRDSSVSYLHPLFLEKARRYFRAFAQQARPFMAENGGPVAMLQVDNELMGIHLWFGSMDYNAETMGFGRADGRYPRWLEAKYGFIDALNEAYGTSFSAFADARPIAPADAKGTHSCRRVRDYSFFYRECVAEYAVLLRSWLREDGLNAPICHNSGNPTMNVLYRETVRAMGGGFLLGSDHYYNLGQSWAQNNPTPQYALRVLTSCETMRALGMPPSVLELPGGSPSDTPPILPEDLLACYMTNLALGVKGFNYYVYTGGPNFPDTGNTCDLYDYNALVHADGSLNATYASLKTFGDFMRSHGWMQRARRRASVQIGFEWNMLRSEDYDDPTLPFTGAQAAHFMERGLLYTLMCSRYSPELAALDGPLDLSRPLIVPCPSAMTAAAQRAVADFVRGGGRALILPVLPEADEEGRASSVLADALGNPCLRTGQKLGPAIEVKDVGRVFGMQRGTVCECLPEGAEVLATDARTGRVVGYRRRIGAGEAIFFGGAWELTTFPQAEMLEHFMALLGAKPCVEHTNRHLFTALWDGENGRHALFVMNLYSAPQRTELFWGEDCEPLGEIELRPMEVRVLELQSPFLK